MGVKVREKVAGSGIWWLFVSHKGRRFSQQVGPKAEALKAKKYLEAKIALGELDFDKPQRQPTFAEYAQGWLATIRATRRESTLERYRGILEKHLLPRIGKLDLDKVGKRELRQVILGMKEKGLSDASLRLSRDVLSGIFGSAVDEELLSANPATGVLKRLGLNSAPREPVRTLTQEDVRAFLETCRQHYPDEFPVFLCGFRTGMRLGEILALRWEDIDWRNNRIQVERSIRRGKINRTKTGRARLVDMSDQLREVLKALLTRRKREGLQAGLSEEIPWVFHRGGSPIPANSLRYPFRQTLKKAGFSHMRIHDMRHTYASLLLSNGESPAYVKEQLGHASIQMTVDIYGHLIPSSNRQAVNRLDDMAEDKARTEQK